MEVKQGNNPIKTYLKNVSLCQQTDIFYLVPIKNGNIVALILKKDNWHIFRQQATVKFKLLKSHNYGKIKYNCKCKALS